MKIIRQMQRMFLLLVFLFLGHHLLLALGSMPEALPQNDGQPTLRSPQDDDMSCIYDPCGCMIKASENGEFDKDLCEQCRVAQGAPMHYCDCHSGTKFYYGIDEYIKDTVWYTVRLSDVVDNGFVAYWFSEKGLQLDVFLQCNVNTPFMSQYVFANGSFTISGDALLEEVKKYGSVGEMVMQGMDIHIRLAPEDGVEGHAMCFQKDHGFHSTCDETYLVYLRMKYGISYSDNVYKMMPDIMGRQLFVMWRQDDNLPIEMDILEQCDGQPVATTVLTDSLHVYFIDTLLLQQKQAQNKPLYFRFRAENHGTIKFSYPFHWRTNEIDTMLCNGQQFELRELFFTTDTSFVDTIRFIRDTITESVYKIQFEESLQVLDTVYVDEADMPYYDDFYEAIIREYKNYTIVKTDAYGCSTEYQMTVLPKKKDNPVCPGDPDCPPEEIVCPGDPNCPPEEIICPGDPNCPPDDSDGIEQVLADGAEPLMLTDIMGKVILNRPSNEDIDNFFGKNTGVYLLVVRKGNEQIVMKLAK